MTMNLDDEALACHQPYLNYQNLLMSHAWDESISDLIETFDGDFSNLMLELNS